MKKRTKRLAILLSAVMIATMMPVSAFAEEIEEPSAETVIEQVESVESDVDVEITEAVSEADAEITADNTAEEVTEISEAENEEAIEEEIETEKIDIEEETEDVKDDSGNCGGWLTWSLNTDTGLLTISKEAGAANGEMYDYDIRSAPWEDYSESIKNVVIKDGVTSIGKGAFEWCDNIVGVTLPESLQLIGEAAFSNCSALTGIKLPSGITSIEESTFSRCTSLENISLPSGLTSIGDDAFYQCTSLKSINIPSGVTSIGDYAFKQCTSLTSINIPSGVTSIGDYAFSNCFGLKSINIPSGVTSIGNYVFGNCASLMSIDIPSGVTSIGDYAFSNCVGLTSINIPSGVTSIGTYAFYSSSKITSITFSEGIETIGTGAFAGLSKLTDIYVFTDNENYPKELLTYERSLGIYYDDYGKLLNFFYDFEINVHIKAPLLATPSLPTLANVSKGVKVTWTKVDGAEKYRVFRKASGSSTWSKVGDTTSTTLTDTKATAGKTYYYTVCCISADGTETSDYNQTGKAIRVLSAIAPTLTNTSSGVSLKWTKAAGATGYYIYRKTGSASFAKIKTITSVATVSYTDTAVKANNGTTYTYAVKAYYSSYTSEKVDKKICRLTGKSISTLTNVATNKMVVKWTKDAKVTGYQIQYSKSSTFASGNTTSTITSNATVSKTIASLTRGSTYYVRLRTYKTVSGVKYYSAWSAKKYVKIAK